MECTISSLIGAAEEGDGAATEALFSALYSELHRLAKRELARRGGACELERNHAPARGISGYGRARRPVVSRPGTLYGLRLARHAECAH